MAKFTREQLKKWNEGAAEGWSVDVQTLIFWNEKTLVRRTEPDENGNMYEATLRYHEEREGDGWMAKSTGRQIVNLIVNKLIPAASNRPEDECAMYSVNQKISRTIGEPQNKKMFSYMQKLSFSVDFAEIIREAKGEEADADLLDLEPEEIEPESVDENAAICEGMIFVDAHGERQTITRLTDMEVEINNGQKSIYDFGTSRTIGAILNSIGHGSKLIYTPAEEATEEATEEETTTETPKAPYKTAEEITAAFIADGWTETTAFRDATPEEISAAGVWIEQRAERGEKFYIMTANGNFYDQNGSIIYYNIPTAAESEENTTETAQEATEEETAEEMPTEAEESATEDESAAQDETPAAAFPDMFATLAAAYISGKTAPSAPRKPQEPPKAAEPTETPTEEEKIEEEPPAPPKTAPGYTGETSEAFTAEEIQALTNGEQVRKVIEGYNTFTIATPYTERTALVYRMSRYIYRNEPETDPLTPGDNLQYIGFINGGKFYANTVPIVEEMREDINNALLHEIPDEATAEERAADASDWQKERTEAAKGYDYTREAQRHFYEGTAPTIQLYRDGGKKYSAADIIRYIENPGEIITEYRNTYAENHAAEIHREYIEYNRTMEAYKAIITDADNPAHVIKAIADSIHEEKTVRIELSNGETVKAEAWTVRNIRNYGTIDAWHLSTADAEKLPKNENGRPADITAEDIKAIYHGQRTLYRAA